MSIVNVGSGYIFVIDTDEYAGNFERHMCGYLTGITGDCGVCVEAAKRFAKDMGLNFVNERVVNNPFADIVQNVSEDGCYRPCSIWETPGWYNNGQGGHFKSDSDDSLALGEYVKSVEKYYGDLINNVAKLPTEEDTPENRKRGAWTKKGKEKEISRYQEEIDKARKQTKPSKYPAYLSVAIFFEKKPTNEQIDFMKSRAYEFAKDTNARPTNKPRSVNISGFRLLKVIPETYIPEEYEEIS